jgi:hypothetical protein
MTRRGKTVKFEMAWRENERGLKKGTNSTSSFDGISHRLRRCSRYMLSDMQHAFEALLQTRTRDGKDVNRSRHHRRLK